MNRPRFSGVRFLQGLIMLGFSIYLIKLLFTGDVYKFVAPYMAVLLGITLAVMIVLCFYSLAKIFDRIVPADQIPPQPVAGAELSLITLYSNILIAPEYFFNQVYKYQGMVYHPPGWPADRFILVRYVISCCSADATPIGVAIEHKEAATYKDNEWVELTGPLLTRNIPELDEIPPTAWYYGQTDKPVVIARTIQPIPEPETPYLKW